MPIAFEKPAAPGAPGAGAVAVEVRGVEPAVLRAELQAGCSQLKEISTQYGRYKPMKQGPSSNAYPCKAFWEYGHTFFFGKGPDCATRARSARLRPVSRAKSHER